MINILLVLKLATMWRLVKLAAMCLYSKICILWPQLIHYIGKTYCYTDFKIYTFIPQLCLHSMHKYQPIIHVTNKSGGTRNKNKNCQKKLQNIFDFLLLKECLLRGRASSFHKQYSQQLRPIRTSRSSKYFYFGNGKVVFVFQHRSKIRSFNKNLHVLHSIARCPFSAEDRKA